jgi:hypothetical protein
MADLIENNKSGILVDPYNHQEIIEALQMLTSDNQSRCQLSINARKSILEKQKLSQAIEHFQEFYCKILRKNLVKN